MLSRATIETMMWGNLHRLLLRLRRKVRMKAIQNIYITVGETRFKIHKIEAKRRAMKLSAWIDKDAAGSIQAVFYDQGTITGPAGSVQRGDWLELELPFNMEGKLDPAAEVKE